LDAQIVDAQLAGDQATQEDVAVSARTAMAPGDGRRRGRNDTGTGRHGLAVAPWPRNQKPRSLLRGSAVVRSWRRRLQVHVLSHAGLLREARERDALHLLRETALSIAAIASATRRPPKP
jgi:hypothetical protein